MFFIQCLQRMSIFIIILLNLPGFFIYQKQELCSQINHLYFQAKNCGTLFQIQLEINPHITVLVEGSKEFNTKIHVSFRLKLNISLFHIHSLSLYLSLSLSVLLISVVCSFVFVLFCPVMSCFVLSCHVLFILSCFKLLCHVMSYLIMSVFCPLCLVL